MDNPDEDVSFENGVEVRHNDDCDEENCGAEKSRVRRIDPTKMRDRKQNRESTCCVKFLL